MQTQGASDAADSSVTLAIPDDPTMRDQLSQIFKQNFKTQYTDDIVQNQAIEALIARKVNTLVETGITADALNRRLATATRVDQYTAAGEGIASAGGFTIASTAAHLISHAMTHVSHTEHDDVTSTADPHSTHAIAGVAHTEHGAEHGAITGAIFGAIHAVLAPVIHASSHVGFYTKGPIEKLDPVMQQYAQQHQRDMFSEFSVTRTSIIAPYSCRNIVMGAIDSASVYFNGAPLSLSGSLVCENLLSLPVGIGEGSFIHYRDQQDGLSSNAYVLARTDLLPLLEELKHDALSMQRAKNLLSRSINGGIAGLKALPHAALQLLHASGLAEITVLAASHAMASYMHSSMSPDATPFEKEVRKQIIHTLVLNNVYAVFSGATVIAKKYGWHLNWSRIGQALVPHKQSVPITSERQARGIRVIGRASNNAQLTAFASLSKQPYKIAAESQLTRL